MRLICLFLALLVLPFGSLRSAAEAARVPRLALLNGEGSRSLPTTAFSQLEALLSAQPGWAMVEREQVRLLLSELKLGAAGLSKTVNSAKLGKLLAADLLVFVERLPGTGNESVRIKIVEASSGISLAVAAGDIDELTESAAPIAENIQQALTKWRVPIENRHYLGLLGFSSEDIGPALDAFAGLLEGWMLVDLGSASNIIVLDREHLEYLRQEEHLTALELQMRGSALLMQGFLSRPIASAAVTLKLSLTDSATKQPELLTLDFNTNNFRAVRETITAAVSKRLNLKPPRATPFDPVSEAALFMGRANALAAAQQYEAATRAAEAGLALCPSKEYKMRTSELRNDICARTYHPLHLKENEPRKLERDAHGRLNPPPDIKLNIYRNASRAVELFREAVDMHLAETKEHPNCTNYFPRPSGDATYVLHALQLGVDGDTPEIQLLRKELKQAMIVLFRLERDYYAKLWNCPPLTERTYLHPQKRWHTLVWHGLLDAQEWTDDVYEYTNLLHEIIVNYQNPPGPPAYPDMADFQFWYHLNAGPLRFPRPEQKKVILQFADGLCQEKNPALRFIGHRILSRQEEPSSGRNNRDLAARQLLDFFMKELPYDDPVRQRCHDYWFPSFNIATAIENLTNAQERVRYSRAILTPILQAKDGVRIFSWERVVNSCLKDLERLGQPQAALELGRACLEILPWRPKVKSGDAMRFRVSLMETCHRLDPPKSLPAAWSDYELTLLGTDTNPGAVVASAAFHDDQPFLLWLQGNSNNAHLQLRSFSPRTRNFRQIGEVSLKGERDSLSVKEHPPMAVDQDTVWVGARGHVVAFRNGAVRVFSQPNGLPGTHIRSLACLDGQVYLAFRWGLGTLDPQTGHCSELFSGRSGNKPALLQGLEFGFSLLLADTNRHCFYFTASARRTGSTRLKYTPKTKELERLPVEPWAGSGSVSWQQGQILYGGQVAFHPETKQVTWLLDASSNPKSDSEQLFGFLERGENFWIWQGDELLSGGDMLLLRKRTQPEPAALLQAPNGLKTTDIVGLHQAGDGAAFIVTARGEIWSLRKKSQPQ